MRVRILAAAGTAALALAGSVLAASPAFAVCGATGDVCSGSTVATFTVTGGTLQISVPSGDNTTPDTLGGANAAAGALTASGNLGAVSVADQRAALAAAWAVTVASTNFVNITTGGTSAQETVLNTAVGYNPGTAGAATKVGNGTFSPVNAPSVGASAPVASWAGIGVNSVTWNPSVAFTLLPDQVAGTYRGTITHTLV